uniref:EOG090X0A5G n=1 Tax=Scapholeberis mucronata TaxID=202097 RepID=A0A4Y7NNI4_9CRUS|nr:EOG090X0A5G [Scapholeberis mucronata]SVE93765.1 EOG090X0A5G [Scapholeberis mucronata]
MNKLLKLSIAVVLLASIIAVYQPDVFTVKYMHDVAAKYPALVKFFKWLHSSNKGATQTPDGNQKSGSQKNEPTRVFTKEELAKYKGVNDGKIYIALMGRVFDVSRGKDFYGPGGGYSFFSGVDGSRAFVTGDFKPEGLIDDIAGLGSQDYIGLRDWLDFYMKDYDYIGKVEGLFFDAKGNPTQYYYDAQEWIKAASNYKEEEDLFKEKYPMCNVDYKPEEGSRVWCSTKSGGVKRDWVGVPRSLYSADAKNIRCACAQEADLSDPLLKEYPNCPKDATSCMLPK